MTMESSRNAGHTILIAGGTVVNAEGFVRADVLVRGERIVGIGVDQDWDTDETIDATGKYILPGGIDVHTHLEYPIDGFTTRTADDFATGSVAAAFGGTTTFIDFVKKRPDASLFDTFVERRSIAESKSIVDFGLHAIVPPLAQQPDVHDDLVRLFTEQGVSSWKFFMAYPGTQMVEDDELLAGMDLALKLGAFPMVHAENGHMVNRAAQQLLAEGKTAEIHHVDAHGHSQEAEAVHRAIVLAAEVGTPLYVVHVSSEQAAAEIAAARSEGMPVWGETCPQYLVAALEDYQELGERAAGYICSPPIRERANQAALWKYLGADGLSTLATDHAAFCMEQPEDLPPQKLRSPGYFPKTPNGVPGLEDRMMVAWEAGVVAGALDLCRFVEITAARPAKLFGMYPNKGTISVGADADIVVWDPEADHTITAAGGHSRTDYNLYEGMRVSGLPITVMSRGRTLILDRELQEVARTTRGRYLSRGAAQLF